MKNERQLLGTVDRCIFIMVDVSTLAVLYQVHIYSFLFFKFVSIYGTQIKSI